MDITPVARFRSPFSSKFGIPKQSGIIASLRGSIEFEPPFTFGLSGSFPPILMPPTACWSGLLAWAATSGWGSSLPAAPFVLMGWGFLPCA